MKIVLASVVAVGLMAAVVPTTASAAGVGFAGVPSVTVQHDSNVVDARWHHRSRWCRSWGWGHHHRRSCRGWGWR